MNARLSKKRKTLNKKRKFQGFRYSQTREEWKSSHFEGLVLMEPLPKACKNYPDFREWVPKPRTP